MSAHEHSRTVSSIAPEHPSQPASHQQSLSPPILAPSDPSAPELPVSGEHIGLLSVPQQQQALSAAQTVPIVQIDSTLLSTIMLAMMQTQQMNTQLLMLQHNLTEKLLAERRMESQQCSLQMEKIVEEIEDVGPSSCKRPANQLDKKRPIVPAKAARIVLPDRPSGPAARMNLRPPTRCQGCGHRGHKVQDCWKVLGRCYRCGSADHQVRECPVPKNRNIPTLAVPQSHSGNEKEQNDGSTRDRSAEGSCC